MADTPAARVEIPEITGIDALDDIAEDYARRHFRPATALSHWDPSDALVERLKRTIAVPPLREPIRYRFPYQIDTRNDILRQLGSMVAERRILVTENGTCAVAAAANALALLGVQRVHLMTPCYFAAKHALERCGVAVIPTSWTRADGSFTLPDLPLSRNDALWLEDPIFNTGVAPARNEIRRLIEILDRGFYVVADQALSMLPSWLEATLATYPRFIGIYAPHKAICVNGLKFGAATFHEEHYTLFDHWSDIINGGLSLSAEAAIQHFLSVGFSMHAEAVGAQLADGDKWMSECLSARPRFSSDRATSGYWRTIYMPERPAESGENLDWVKQVVEQSGSTFIPGTRAKFHRDWGFCFRVNLLRLDRSGRAGLVRLLNALEAHSPAPETP